MNNKKNGFTLIELLAVIVILGILAVTAIPAINRVIENSRKDTFVNTAKEYAVQATNLFSGDSIKCYYCTDANGTGRDPKCSAGYLSGVGENTSSSPVVSSALDNGLYFIPIDTEASDNTVPVLLEQGGKSSWGNRNVAGYVLVEIKGSGSNKTYDYYIALSDGTHYVTADKLASKLDRNDIKSDGTGLDVNWLPYNMLKSRNQNASKYYTQIHELSVNFHVMELDNQNKCTGGKPIYNNGSLDSSVSGLKGFYSLDNNTLPNAGYCVADN